MGVVTEGVPGHVPGYYSDIRQLDERGQKHFNSWAYRIFPDGHFEDLLKTGKYTNISDMSIRHPLGSWFWTTKDVCGGGQQRFAMDPESKLYAEEDGSNLFPPGSQGDFIYIPTKYT